MKPRIVVPCAVQHNVVGLQRLRAQYARHCIAQRPIAVLPDDKDNPSKFSSDP